MIIKSPAQAKDLRLHFRRARGALIGFFLVLTGSAPIASAQCAGDCNGDGHVSVAELVVATRVALGEEAACGSLDHAATIDEVVTAVNNAHGTCPIPATPTPTSTPTPTQTTGQATVTPTAVAGCGDNNVDATIDETCDDGNTADGDSCPANCRIATCATVVIAGSLSRKTE